MHYYYGKMTKDNRKAKVVARKSLEKSKISALSEPEVKSPICWGT